MTVRHPYARQLAWVLVCFVLACAASLLPASARSKPGPVDERGVATHIASGRFTLLTTRHGSLAVVVTRDTAVTMSGKRSALREGDHVGVRGFRSAGSIRAIWVHIYSHAANRPFSVSGTVISVTATGMVLQMPGKTQVIWVGTGAPVVIVRRKATLADVRSGDHVRVRVQRQGARLVAVGIHVYARPQEHVSFSGTVVGVEGVLLTVKTSVGDKTVRVGASTVIYLGASRTPLTSIKRGQIVRVYACCSGTPLTATSIHIHRTKVHVTSEYLHGTVQRVLPGTITVVVAGRTVGVSVSAATHYQISSQPARISDVRIGDEVTILVHKLGTRLLAIRVDVPAASRIPHTLIGTVVSVSGPVVTLLARGHRYRLDISPNVPVTLGGRRVAVGALRDGDRVHVTGLLRGSTVEVSWISAVRPLPPVKTIRGTIMAVGGPDLVIVDSAGRRYTARIPPGVQATVHGVPSPAAVFPGARVTVKGVVSGSIIHVQSLVVSVTIRDVTGRLISVARDRLRIGASGRTVVVDTTGSPAMTDSGKRVGIRDLHAGAFADVRGYSPGSGRLRATSIRVLHPALDLRGTLSLGNSGYEIHLPSGEVYRLHFTRSTQVTNELKPISMTIEDVPAGTRVHVVGKARSDGSLGAGSVIARLSSVTLRGMILAIAGDMVTVSAATGPVTARVDAEAPVTQGSRSLQLTDVVVGDDVTVEGYQARTTVLARALLVHRSLVGLDGVVQATGRDGLTLTTASGVVRVAVGADTVVTGTVSVGIAIHVTGYRRGDGVILATRLRVGK